MACTCASSSTPLEVTSPTEVKKLSCGSLEATFSWVMWNSETVYRLRPSSGWNLMPVSHCLPSVGSSGWPLASEKAFGLNDSE
ncbi:hypothetical protein D9M71_549140 [compost metagenome]